MTHTLKSTAWPHQTRAADWLREREVAAIFMEMRTGKSRVLLDDFLHQFSRGNVYAFVVIAPNGVHRNWVSNEIAAHWPDDVPLTCMAWDSSDTTKRTEKAREAFLKKDGRLRFLSVNVEAFRSGKTFDFVMKFLRSRKCMFAIDESHRIKTPNIQRTKSILTLSQCARYKRILTGTPSTQSPLDLWSQFKFLKPGILPASFAAYRAEYCELLPPTSRLVQSIRTRNNLKFDPVLLATGRDGQPIYRNLDDLRAKIAPYSLRILRSDCKDVPPKVFDSLPVDLAPAQRAAYEAMRKRSVAELSTGVVTAPLVITKLLRLQQILGGFIKQDDGTEVALFESDADNPRIAALLEAVESMSGKVIVWARFVREIEAIAAALDGMGMGGVVTYHGAVPQDARESAVASFGSSNGARFFVGQPHSGGIGLPLHAADTMVFYSNDFSLETRLQAEDRAQHMEKETPVDYLDLYTPHTIDEKIMTALRNKMDVARAVTGDAWKEWI